MKGKPMRKTKILAVIFPAAALLIAVAFKISAQPPADKPAVALRKVDSQIVLHTIPLRLDLEEWLFAR